VIQGSAVHDEVLDHRERARVPRLDVDGRAIGERAHVQLAGGGGGTAVRDAVDDDATHAADALAAVVVEGHRLLVRVRELLVEKVKHLQERHVLGHAIQVVLDHLAGGVGAGLTPDT